MKDDHPAARVRKSAQALDQILRAASNTHGLNAVDLWRHDKSGKLVGVVLLSFREDDLSILVSYRETDREPPVTFTRTLPEFLDRFTRIPS